MPKCSIAGVVQLTPAGEWYSCCGITSMELPQLKLGRAEEIPLAEVESRVMARDFLRIIFLEGWAWIYLKASQLGQPFPQRVTMNCECCSFLFAHPELMAAMAEEAHSHAASLKPRKVQAGGVFQRALKGATHGN
ncbi:hypothetical protein [Selenomonas sp. KH1T6]|uniref:hypothetical protein n=1 Tax=Selenomonas sp. KH1T6 TaxID=3158784 RepID=UPI0008A73F6A|nr:hypothetical protein SAMN05216583_12126 [Selenomonas ruminantium]